MSNVLEVLKPTITKARSFAYFGRYDQSVALFSETVHKIEAQITAITDKTLLTEWNKLLDEIKNEKQLAFSMKEVLEGASDTSGKPKQKPKLRDEHGDRPLGKVVKQHSFVETDDRPISKPSFKKNIPHQDDELYNEKDKYAKNKQRENQREAEKEKLERQKQFEERQLQIWPKKPVLTKKNTGKSYQRTSGAGNNNQNPNNNSGVNANKPRQYGKPWQANMKPAAQNGNGATGKEERKSFLKQCYPDGQGPDTNLIQMLEREVVQFNPGVTFDDIAQLEKAKDVLEQAVLLPLKMPHLFRGIRRAWKGVLLFGPPGTGKTLLAKAIASCGQTTFFNVTSSTLASKWKGQSEKLVRILFEMAKFYAPTTIFIDEIDSLASKRSEKEDESSRKVKTQFMTNLDGVSSGKEGQSIVVIGATNRPWDLDEAIRRRLEKRIYIPLPTEIGRREMLRINLKDVVLEGVDFQQIVKRTDGYSGADLSLLCREAAFMPMRRKLKKEGGLGKKLQSQQWKKDFEKQVAVPLTMDDFQKALESVKPSVGKQHLQTYEKWMKEFGEQGTN